MTNRSISLYNPGNYKRFLLSVCVILQLAISYAQAPDSTKRKIKEPKHYFMPTFYFDQYRTGERALNSNKPVNQFWDKRLKSYSFVQSSGGFYIPLYTKDRKKNDSAVTSNFHLLLTGNYMFATPHFDGISDHIIFKGGVGMRGIYNSGNKNIWFFDVSPFVAQDISHGTDLVLRSVSTLIYDRIVSDKFSFRLGYSKTFLLGNRYRLPYIGFRVGRLDKTYLSVQFPRNITLSFPMGSKFRGSFYTKPMGGLYTFSNSDTLYFGTDKTIQFGRYELNHGFRVDYKASKNFSFYAAIGGSGNSYISMMSFSYNKDNKGLLTPFFIEKLGKAGFGNIGMTLRFGNAKKVYNNRNMYEVFDINSTVDPGDNNTNPGNEIPSVPKKVKNLGYKDVQDLIDTQDLY
ncbi:MAG: hypothetical protein ACJ76F_09310 [Bacteroidia bacterium]